MSRLFTSNFNKVRPDKFFAWAIVLFFLLLAALTLVVTQNEYLWTKLVTDPSYTGKFFNGDLYAMSLVSDFKEKITELPLADDRSTPETSKYIAKGDSFFATGFDSPPVYNFLQDNLSGGVYFHSFPNDPTPLDFLNLAGFKKGGPKVFIWETAEFYSIDRAMSAQQAGLSPSIGSLGFKGLAENLLAKLKPNRARFEFFIENNKLVEPLRAWIKNKDYEWFGDIDGETPVYSVNPKMLFINDDVTFLQNTGKISQIPELANNIAGLAQKLKQQYNMTLVYLIVPDKLSVYADTLPYPSTYTYDNYIPLLQKALSDRAVQYVDVYGAMLAQKLKTPDQLLYYPGDHHYTPLGKQVLEEALMEKLKNLPK